MLKVTYCTTTYFDDDTNFLATTRELGPVEIDFHPHMSEKYGSNGLKIEFRNVLEFEAFWENVNDLHNRLNLPKEEEE